MSLTAERLRSASVALGVEKHGSQDFPAAALRRAIDDDMDRGIGENIQTDAIGDPGELREKTREDAFKRPNGEQGSFVSTLTLAVAATLFLFGYVALAATDPRTVTEIEGR